jgi:cytochrome c peroxidase
MPVMSTAHNSWQFWDGRKDSQWSQALGPLESAVEHNTTRVGVVRVLAQHHSAAYIAIFGALPDLAGLPLHAGPVTDATAAEAWATIPPERQDAINRASANLGKAIAAFERRIAYGPSRFDRFVDAVVAGEPVPATVRLTPDEQAGARLFVGKGECITCHTGPLLTDQQFHNLGIPGTAGLATDEGRWAGARTVRDDPFNCLGPYSDALPTDCTALQHLTVDVATLLGAFKTPSLRNVAERAPYMHAGQLASLEAVMDHYDGAPAAELGTTVLRPLQLTAGERAQLVAFLRSLSGPVEVPTGP